MFRLKIGPADLDDPASADARAKWISLPIDREKADQFVKDEFGAAAVEDCSCFDIESGIPQISAGMFKVMDDFNGLNAVAERYLAMTESEQIRFKAILEAENIQNVDEAMSATDRLHEYGLAYFVKNEGDFFREYLHHHLPAKFDARWLDTFAVSIDVCKLPGRLGASVTEYGVLSARGGSLYDLVSYDAPQECQEDTENLTEATTDEDEAQEFGGMQL